VVRRAVPDDAPALARLGEAHAAFEGIAVRASLASRVQGLEKALLQQRLFAWLVLRPISAAVSSRPEDLPAAQGYASLTLDFSTLEAERFAHLDCLYLNEILRGQGWGQVLLKRACSFARAQGCRQLQWQTPEWNEAASRFYRRHGAQELVKRRFILALST
jgi:GNAT superfamily N-acetyltransferase